MMLELNHIYNMDCMEGMKQIQDKAFELAIASDNVKPFRGTFNIGEVTRPSFKWGIIRRKHPINLRNMDTGLPRYFGLVGYGFTKFNHPRIVLNTLLVVIRTTQSIHAKIKRFGHIAVKNVSNLAGVKAYKSEHIDLAVIVPMRVILSVTLDVKNICLALLRSLRNDARRSSSLYLYAQKALSVIHENIIRKPLLTWESNKALHDKVGANKVFTGFADLEFVAKSHNITSDTLYHTYDGIASAISKAVA